MFELMYYPLVHPPRRTLFESVLYWNGLTSLVPEGGHPGDYEFGQDLDLLKAEGLYRRTELARLMFENWDVFGKVMQTIERVVDKADPRTLVIPDRLAADTRLWSGKLPDVIENELIRKKLLVEDESAQGALRGNPRVLLATIACLAEEASMLLETRSHRVVPTTDNAYSHHCATLPLDDNDVRISWMIDVGALMPVPDESTDLAEVIAFRKDHDEELGDCMTACRELLAEVRRSGITNAREVVMEFERRLSESVTEVRNAGKARFRWAATRSAWIAVASAATVTGAAVVDVPVVLAAAATVASGVAVNLATAPTRPRDSRYSYLHHLTTNFSGEMPSIWRQPR